jgi:hypothetical protein
MPSMLASLPVEVCEMIFSLVVWDDFSPERVDTLNKASECIRQLQERNRQLRTLRLTAKFVNGIAYRLSFKYVHVTSRERAEELADSAHEKLLPGLAVRHLFVGDRLGRFHSENAPTYGWMTQESASNWIDFKTLHRLLQEMPYLRSLHIHLPGIHSKIFSSAVQRGLVAPLASLATIQCMSLYDDINNSPRYQPVKNLSEAKSCLSVFPRLRTLIVSESEGLSGLDRFIGTAGSEQSKSAYAPNLETIMLEKWCPMHRDVILYNLAMDTQLTDLMMSRRVPRRMSMDGT